MKKKHIRENLTELEVEYMWLWKKETPTGFLNANYKSLNVVEEIAVFSKASAFLVFTIFGSMSNVGVGFVSKRGK